MEKEELNRDFFVLKVDRPVPCQFLRTLVLHWQIIFSFMDYCNGVISWSNYLGHEAQSLRMGSLCHCWSQYLFLTSGYCVAIHVACVAEQGEGEGEGKECLQQRPTFLDICGREWQRNSDRLIQTLTFISAELENGVHLEGLWYFAKWNEKLRYLVKWYYVKWLNGISAQLKIVVSCWSTQMRPKPNKWIKLKEHKRINQWSAWKDKQRQKV